MLNYNDVSPKCPVYFPFRLINNAWMILDTASHTNTRNHLGRSEGLTPINVKTSASITNPAIQLIVTMNIISPLLTAPRPPSSWINYTAAFLRIHQLCTDSPQDWSQNRPMCGCDDHSLTVSSAESDSLVLSVDVCDFIPLL